MKKDYRPVSKDDSDLSETEFVEQYWTRVWEASGDASALNEKIENREEFKLMQPYLATLAQGSRVLDGGCGLGEWTVCCSAKGFEVVGLDLSKITIQKLKERFPQEKFDVGDIRDTRFADNSFDAYFSWGAFEHFEEGLAGPLEEAKRILKPGGYLFITVPFQNTRHLLRDRRKLWLWDETFDKNKGYEGERRFYQWRLTESELHREFEIHGFKAVKIEPVSKDRGVLGLVQCDLCINPNSRIGYIVQKLLAPFISKRFASHMLMGIARKA